MTSLIKIIDRRFDRKTDHPRRFAAVLGDGAGNLKISDRPGYVWARLDTSSPAVPVYCADISPQHDLPVVIEYQPGTPQEWRVVSTRWTWNDPAYVPAIVTAERFRWQAPQGGQDPLFVEGRQIMPFRVTPTGGMNVQVYRNLFYTSAAWVFVDMTTVDMSSYRPATAGLAAWVLVTLSTAGAVVCTKGTEKAIASLANPGDVPLPPTGTQLTLAAVRVWNGQTAIVEARNNTDVIDLRYTGYNNAMINPMTAAGDLIVGGASGTPARLAMGTALQVLRVNATATALEWGTVPTADEKVKISSADTTAGYLEDKLTAGDRVSVTKTNTGANEVLVLSTAGPNLLINGGFDYYQRQTAVTETTRANDTYGPDRWVVLTQTAAIQTYRFNDAQFYGNNFRNWGQFRQPQATAQRFGFLQIVEGANSVPLRGKVVTFQISNNPSNTNPVRGAILAWTGDIDVVTSNVVLNWASTSYAAGGFFLGSNLTVIATGSVSGLTTWGDLVLTGTVPAGCNNLIVMTWTDQPYAQGDVLGVAKASLHAGSVVVPWDPRLTQQEIALCQRFYRKSYALDTAPATATEDNDVLLTLQPIPAATTAYAGIQLGAPMRSTPTWTIYSGYSGASGYAGVYDNATRDAAATIHNAGQNSMYFHYVTPNNGGLPTVAANCHYTVEAEL